MIVIKKIITRGNSLSSAYSLEVRLCLPFHTQTRQESGGRGPWVSTWGLDPSRCIGKLERRLPRLLSELVRVAGALSRLTKMPVDGSGMLRGSAGRVRMSVSPAVCTHACTGTRTQARVRTPTRTRERPPYSTLLPLRGPRRQCGGLLPPWLGEDEGSGTANPFTGHQPGAESRASCFVAVAAFRSCAFSSLWKPVFPIPSPTRSALGGALSPAPFPDELLEAGRGEALLSGKERGQDLNPVLSGFHA